MSCKYTININGESITLLSDVPIGEINDINDLERLLKSQSLENLTAIKSELISVNDINDLRLDDINENSVGFYNPADLLNTLKDKQSAKLFGKLNLGQYKNKAIVISGFGNENVPTQFYKDHIFLNLNYMYDYDNKIVALVELSLYNLDPENYNSNSEFLKSNINSTDPEITEQINGLIKQLTKSKKEQDIENLIKNIRLTYNKVDLKIHKDISDTNISIYRDSVNDIWNKYSILEEERESSYFPKTRIPVQNLKQGDLVLIPVESENARRIYKSGVYEIFFDSYVDIEGNTILRTIRKNSNGELETRKRIAKIYSKNSEGATTIKTSNIVDVRIFSEESFEDYNYSPDTKYASIDTKFFRRGSSDGMIFSESLVEILRNPEIKVIIEKKSHKVKRLSGSEVTLLNGQKISISKINKIDFPVDKMQPFERLNEEDIESENSIWSRYTKASIGEHIAFMKKRNDASLTEGIVIGFGIRNDIPIVMYLTTTATGLVKPGIINESNIRYLSNPTAEYTTSLEEQININKIVETIYGTDIKEGMATPKNGKFRLSNYSVSEINKYSKINPKDILYHKSTNLVFKVISSTLDNIKTSFLVGDVHKHFIIPKKDLENYMLFNDTSINESFALSSVRKNRYGIYTNPRENSIEVNIYKNPNGFIFSLPAILTTAQVEEHRLYEEGAKNITKEMKKELKERYNLVSEPKVLYNAMLEGKTLKNTENSSWIPMDNDKFNKLLESTAGLQNFLVPGSFVTFEGNSKQYIVEKVIGKEVLIAQYHYTYNKNESIKDNDLQFVKSEKFFLNSDILQKVNINGIHIPKWASVAREELSNIIVDKPSKSSKFNPITNKDSVEIVMAMVDLVKQKFGVDINIITNKDLESFNNPEIIDSAAFVTPEGIYINIDRSNLEEPVHELLHLVLLTMKHSNPDEYYALVNLVQYHPLFKEVLDKYEDVNTELLEETFVTLLSKTFRKNIIENEMFTSKTFNNAMKSAISELMDLTYDLEFEDTFNLLGKSAADVLYEFGSSLIDNDESLINSDNANYMFGVSSKIKSLLKSGLLKQKCNY